MTTDSFTIELYAVDSPTSATTYKIAMVSSGLDFSASEITTGSIAAFTLTAANTTVGATTTYSLTV